MRRISTAVVAAIIPTVLVTTVSPALADNAAFAWNASDTGVTTELRGLSVVSDQVAWAGGLGGTILRTTNGGGSWQKVSPTGREALDFRDIEAFSADRAIALATGENDKSLILLTTDGGATWTETFKNTEPKAFYDCAAFTDATHGLALSDPVDGKFRIIATADAGATWTVQPNAGMPPAKEKEYAFAATGSCLVAPPGAAAGTYLFASGGPDASHVYKTVDNGVTWTVADTTFPATEYGGASSLAFRNATEGVAVGGDAKAAAGASGGVAVTGDAGASWKGAAKAPADFRSGAAWVDVAGNTLVAVGMTGSDVSTDGGQSWTTFDKTNLFSIDCAASACFAVGADGKAATLTR